MTPPKPLTPLRLSLMRLLVAVTRKGSTVDGEVFAEAYAEIVRLRALLERVVSEHDEYGMDSDHPLLIELQEEGLGIDTGV